MFCQIASFSALRRCISGLVLYLQNILALLRVIVDAFGGARSSRSEPHVLAERLVAVYDFTKYFADYAIPIEGTTTAACFLFKKNAEGRTIVRTKAWSHMDGWDDDETVALFHVCCIFLASESPRTGWGGGGGVPVHPVDCLLSLPPKFFEPFPTNDTGFVIRAFLLF